ncbi:FadR family transcriptional regulator [Paenibacillus hemerocallicola]|uniref:FadR family transcriptional regulator n=1 Tax=Paenibacillus hemerocallicola TaxID=1172614 RepID=A0A5C4T5Y0_9BACL|nr:FCD domain-containing protein [Paenibacillus hemerocallicola]TNJ63609.1 FadR family transcriptional regulator [Paenibacillus hemerocallicola]
MATPYLTRFKHVNALKVSDFILEQLEEAIILKEFLADEQLPPERELATMFKASRLAVREAIAELEKRGLIERRLGAKGGTFVLPLTAKTHQRSREEIKKNWDQMKEMFEFRTVIEPEAARLAAERMNRLELEQIKHFVQQSIEPDVTREMFRALDVRFHLRIVSACRNSFFENAVRRVRTIINPALDLMPFSQKVQMTTYNQHMALLQAFEARDGERAGVMMREHIDETSNAIYEKVFGNGPEAVR